MFSDPDCVVCWDLDGTLVSVGTDTHGPFQEAANQLGLAAPRIDVHGKTDLGICAELLAATGHTTTAPAELLALVEQVTIAGSARFIAGRSVLPGVNEILRLRPEGLRHVLCTGNSPLRAQAKLEPFGLWDRFDLDLSTFGDTTIDRLDLLLLARDRVARRFPRARIVVIGDTPLDIRAGRSVGSVIAVATGTYGAEELAKERPAIVVSTLTEGFDEISDLLKANRLHF